jgi:hypothetical protein
VAVRSTAATGQDSIVDELDSNDLAASTVAQVRREPWRDAGFDFQDNVHYSDESLVKTTIGGNPLIRTIQICATICQDSSAGAAARRGRSGVLPPGDEGMRATEAASRGRGLENRSATCFVAIA